MIKAYVSHLIAASVLALATCTTTAQTLSTVPGASHIRINQFDPTNPEHAAIAESAKIICLSKFKDRITSGRAAAESAKSREDGAALLKSLLREALDEAGACAYTYNYNSSVFEMRTITGMGSNFNTISSAPAYIAAQKKSAQSDAEKCKQVRYPLLTSAMTNKQFAENGPALILDATLFCMSLLGKQSGVLGAMDFYRITLN